MRVTRAEALRVLQGSRKRSVVELCRGLGLCNGVNQGLTRKLYLALEGPPGIRGAPLWGWLKGLYQEAGLAVPRRARPRRTERDIDTGPTKPTCECGVEQEPGTDGNGLALLWCPGCRVTRYIPRVYA